MQIKTPEYKIPPWVSPILDCQTWMKDAPKVLSYLNATRPTTSDNEQSINYLVLQDLDLTPMSEEEQQMSFPGEDLTFTVEIIHETQPKP